MGFNSLINLVQQGEPVAAGTVNRPTAEVAQNAQYLYDLIQAANLGSAIFARQVTVEAAAQVGMAVYYNGATQQFERAIAQLDNAGGVLTTAASSLVWGVVFSKTNATLADLLIFGYAPLDLSAAVPGTVVSGPYYLSGTVAGALIAQRPAVSVPVLRSDGNGNVFVQPTFVDFLDSHRHYRFSLACYPAGATTPPTPGTAHTITSPNASLPGWLPANHASFAGKAPPGAVFGYNMAQHPSLANAWPPLPIDSIHMEMNRGGDPAAGSQGVPTDLIPQCIVDRNGIWWTSNCWQDAPWPANLVFPATVSEGYDFNLAPPDDVDPTLPADWPLDALGDCPRTVEMELILWFTKISFTTDATVVTALVSDDDRIKIYCQGTTTPASVGGLAISLDLTLMVSPTLAHGSTVLKTLTDGELFHAGPVMEGLYAVGPNVSLSSDVATTHLNEDGTGPVVYQGMVGIAVAGQSTLELTPVLTRLNGATEELYLGAMYIGFDPAVETSILSLFHIPDDIQLVSPKLALQLRILGLSAGVLPALDVTYYRVARPTAGLTTPVTLTSSPASLAITTTGTLGGANQYVEATSDLVTVAAGDLFFITVTRAPSDGYVSQVGILSQTAILSGS